MTPLAPIATFEFALGRDPLTSEEQQVLEPALRRERLDAAYWTAVNGLLTTRSRSDTPLALRAYREGRLAGIAHLIECRRTNRCLFPNALGRFLDQVPAPGYCWTRGDPGVDLMSSPGFVAPGEDPHRFYSEAVAFLAARYPLGSVLEPRGATPAGPCYETPLMAWGRYQVAPGRLEMLMQVRGNLRRKLNKFRNKGGTLQVVSGALDADVRTAVLGCVAQSANHGLLRAPFQENYGNMVRWAAGHTGPEIVHVLARLDGEVVGYHAYLRTGARLQCLSGGFDRRRHTTYHAYENILIETMRYAEEAGLEEVAFGPISNPSKAAVMPQCVPYVLRFYSRFSIVPRILAAVVPRSALRRDVLSPWAELKGALEADPAPVAAAAAGAEALPHLRAAAAPGYEAGDPR